MQKIQGAINDREILYLDLNDSLDTFHYMDIHSWVVFVIADDVGHPLIAEFVEACIDKSVLYACTAGAACSEVNDLFDLSVVLREVEDRQLPEWYRRDVDVLLTTWHHDLAEGYWFVTSVASHERLPIAAVVVANFTGKDYLAEIQQLTDKIRAGWLPSD